MKPTTFEINQFGEQGEGLFSVADLQVDIPFEVKRIVWIYGVDNAKVRGEHANKETSQVFFALKGTLTITLINVNNVSETYILDSPNKGLIVPPNYWRTLIFDENAILLALNSHQYLEDDYIRFKEHFFKK